MPLSRFPVRPVLAVLIVGVVSPALFAAGSVIGVVSAEGSFRLANVDVNDHATLFDGNALQTRDTAPRVDLKDGAWMHFGTGTSAVISGHTVELSSGIGEMGAAPDYSFSVKTLRVTPAGRKSIAQVQIVSDHRVVVAALEAPVRVFNRNGLPVAMVRAGAALSFDPFAADPNTSSLTGCLLAKGGKPILVDPGTYQVSELHGGDWKGEVGNRVTVTGDIVAGATLSIATQALENVTITRVAVGGCAAVAFDDRIKADPVPNSAAGAAAAAAHHSYAAYYVIGGVAVAGGAIGAIEASHKKS